MATTGKIIETDDGETTLYKYSCKYNEGVGCAPVGRNCEKCGWNPKVSKARLEKFCKEHRIAVPQSPREEE